ncbi:MAG: hypothetical protein ACE10C_15260, partial [Candidatus Binatia bacterium]
QTTFITFATATQQPMFFTIDLVYFYSPRTKSVVKQTTHLVSTHGDEAEYEMELIEYGHEAPAVGVPVVKAPK